MDCIHVKARDSHAIINKAVHLAIEVNMEGKKELLGIYG
jgi:putative transposase